MWTRLACAAVLAFSTFAFADSIDYQAAGTLSAGTAFVRGMLSSGHTWEAGAELREITDLTTGVVHNGNLGVVDLTTGTLFHCTSGLCFNGGTLDIDKLNGSDLVLAKLMSGTVSTVGGIAIVTARLADGAATVIRDRSGDISTQALIHGHAAVVPEPTSLMLIGTGLLGMGLLRYRKPL